MFAIASVFVVLGLWVLVAAMLDWDSCLGAVDMRAAGEALGPEAARWAFGVGGSALILIGVLCAL